MFTELVVQVRRFPVTVLEPETSTVLTDTVVLTKDQLHACQLVGQSSKELIHRLYERKGFEVLEIGKATKREIRMDLNELYRAHQQVKCGGELTNG